MPNPPIKSLILPHWITSNLFYLKALPIPIPDRLSLYVFVSSSSNVMLIFVTDFGIDGKVTVASHHYVQFNLRTPGSVAQEANPSLWALNAVKLKHSPEV
jgi:hypothetical protein